MGHILPFERIHYIVSTYNDRHLSQSTKKKHHVVESRNYRHINESTTNIPTQRIEYTVSTYNEVPQYQVINILKKNSNNPDELDGTVSKKKQASKLKSTKDKDLGVGVRPRLPWSHQLSLAQFLISTLSCSLQTKTIIMEVCTERTQVTDITICHCESQLKLIMS